MRILFGAAVLGLVPVPGANICHNVSARVSGLDPDARSQTIASKEEKAHIASKLNAALPCSALDRTMRSRDESHFYTLYHA